VRFLDVLHIENSTGRKPVKKGSPKKELLRSTIITSFASSFALLPFIMAPQAARAAEAAAASVEEIVVTGSRIPRPNIDSNSPVAVVSAAEFQLSGTTAVEDLLNTMPQVVPGFTSTSNNPGEGAATIDLRGLGTERTLVLVDGRRFVATDITDGVAVDINSIPASLIKRVEVLTGGGSSVYGSDAIAGVVNFIMKDDFEGAEVSVQHGITGHNDGKTYDANLTLGGNFAGGRGNAVVFVNYYKRDPVLQADRGYSSVTCGDSGDPADSCGGVAGLAPGGSSTLPGGLLRMSDPSRQITFDPDGSARTRNSAVDVYNYGAVNYLQTPAKRFTMSGMAHYDVYDKYITAFLQTSFSNITAATQLAPTPAVLDQTADAIINLSNPFLSPSAVIALTPYAVNGLIHVPTLQRRMLEVGPRQEKDERNTFQITTGLKGKLDNNWRYEAFYTYGRSTRNKQQLNDVSKTRLLQSLLATTDGQGHVVCIDPSGGCAPANIFGAGNISQAAADYLRVNATTLATNVMQNAGANISGNIVDLPAGPLGFSVGTEWRSESFSNQPDAFQSLGDVLGFGAATQTAGKYTVWEAYLETIVPLIKDQPFAKYLGLEAGYRYSHYSTAGNVSSYKAGGEWSPVGGLKFRGMYQRAVRAPNVFELYRGVSENAPLYVDPCDAADNPSAAVKAFCVAQGVPAGDIDSFAAADTQVTSHESGNAALKAEKSDTYTLGMVWTPTQVKNLAVTVDYYDITVKGAIAGYDGGAQGTIDDCTFSLNLASDACQHYSRDSTGQILIVNLPNANISSLKTKGVDLQLNYKFDLAKLGMKPSAGMIDMMWIGSYKIKNSFQPNAHVASYDCAGIFGVPCGQSIVGISDPKYRFTSRFSYLNGPATVSLRWRWMDGTKDGRILRHPEYVPITNYKAKHYFDLSATYDITENFTLFAGVDNVMDTDPPISGVQQVAANTDPSLYDALGRRFFFGGRAKF
jgi:outer membrane receptor protein involved in Fe transport